MEGLMIDSDQKKPDSDFHVLISSTEPNPKQKLIYGWIICDTIVY